MGYNRHPEPKGFFKIHSKPRIENINILLLNNIFFLSLKSRKIKNGIIKTMIKNNLRVAKKIPIINILRKIFRLHSFKFSIFRK